MNRADHPSPEPRLENADTPARGPELIPADEDACDPVEVLASDFVQRLRAGEQPTVEQYAARHPEWSARIRDCFSAILAMERMKSGTHRSSDGRATTAGRQIRQLGDYRILREIGRGGMGIVYEAEQLSLGRRVAVKILPPHVLLQAGVLEQFRREARTAAGLHHTNIVQIYGNGEIDGVHFLVMQLIEGQAMDRFLAPPTDDTEPRCLAPIDVARMGVQIADAVDFAHQHHVLHRDLKPANMILDQEDHVWVTDFGLAKCLDQQHTASQGLQGSLRYMAPERFSGRCDERSDVYGVGLTLYELLVGKPAFEAHEPGQLMQRICEQGLPGLTGATRPPRDLETIVLKAAHKDPGERYASAAELRDDLQRFCEGLPIAARRTSLGGRWWRWTRRHPWTSAAAALAVASLLTATLASSLGLWAASHANTRTREALTRESRERQRAERTFELALQALNAVADEMRQPPLLQEVFLENEDGEAGEYVATTVSASPDVARILQQIMPLYDALMAEAPQRSDVLWRSIDAAGRLGRMQMQLGQTREAAETLQRGLELLKQPTLLDGVVAADRLALETGRLWNDLGGVRRLQQRHQDAVDCYRQALQVLQGQNQPEGQLQRSRTLLALGSLRSGGPAAGRIGMWPRANPLGAQANSIEERRLRIGQQSLRFLEEAIQILEGLQDEPSVSQDARLMWARCLRWRSRYPQRTPQQRREDAQQATDLLDSLMHEHPHWDEVRFELSQALAEMPLQLTAERAAPREIVQHLQRSLQLSEDLRTAHPAVPAYALASAETYYRLGRIARLRRQPLQARELFQTGTDVQRQLVQRFPEEPSYLMLYMRLLRSLCEVQLAAGDKDQARQQLDELQAVINSQERLGPSPVREQLRAAIQRLDAKIDSP